MRCWLALYFCLLVTVNAVPFPPPLIPPAMSTVTYSNYMGDLVAAINERAAATLTSFETKTYYTRVGSTFSGIVTTRPVYSVSPLTTYITHVPYYIGITADVHYIAADWWDDIWYRYPPVEDKRTVYNYTNGMWITNQTIAVVPLPDGSKSTNILNSQLAYVNGRYVTNVVYNAVHTNMIPNAQYIVTGAAFDLLREGYYLYGPGAVYWTASGGFPWANQAVSDTFHVISTNWTLRAPLDWLPVMGNEWLQHTNAISTSIPFYLYNARTHSNSTVMVTIVCTNYSMTSTVVQVSSTPTYAGNTPVTVDTTLSAGDVITVTSSYQVVINNYGIAMDTLMTQIDVMITNCLAVYACSSNADVSGSFQNFYSNPNNKVWVYNTVVSSGNKWIQQQWGTPPVTAITPIVPELPHWSFSDVLSSTGAGTNLYRKYHVCDSTIIPDLHANYYRPATYGYWYWLYDFDTSTLIWTFADDGLVAPWQMRRPGWRGATPNYNTPWVYDSISTDYVTNDNPKYVAFTNRAWRVTLGAYTYQPNTELTLQARGFSSAFWYTDDTSNAAWIVSMQPWIATINNTTFTRATSSGITYYSNGSIFVMPLVGSMPVTWFIIQDLSAGLDIATDWSTIFDPDVQKACVKMHRLGYPTRVNPYTIGGCTDCGAGGYYYPGGVLRPQTYQLDVVASAGMPIYAHSPSSYYPAGAYPITLDNITWDKLMNWPQTRIITSKAGPNTTTLPVVNIPMTGNILFSSGGDTLYGYEFAVDYTAAEYWGSYGIGSAGSDYPTSELFTVTAPGDTHTMYAYTAFTSPSVIVTTATVNAEVMWNCNSTLVTDRYYTATIISNRPNLQVTSDVFVVDATKYARGTVISIVMSNEMALYTSDPIINPTTFDDRYRVVNELRYIQAIPNRVDGVYDAFTNSYRIVTDWWDPDSPEIHPTITEAFPYWIIGQAHATTKGDRTVTYVPPDPPGGTYTNQFFDWDVNTSFDAGGVVVHGSAKYTNISDTIEWTVTSEPKAVYYPNIIPVYAPYVIEGNGYLGFSGHAGSWYMIGGIGSGMAQYPLYYRSDWSYISLAWSGSDELNSAPYGDMRAPWGSGGEPWIDGWTNLQSLAAGCWAKEMQVVIFQTSNMVYHVDRYALPCYSNGVYSTGRIRGGSDLHLQHIDTGYTTVDIGDGNTWITTTGAIDFTGNCNYQPLHSPTGPLTVGTMMKFAGEILYPTVPAACVVTNSVVFTEMGDLRAEWYTPPGLPYAGTISGSQHYESDPPDYTKDVSWNHDWSYTVNILKSYRYWLENIRYVKRPLFTYTNYPP